MPLKAQDLQTFEAYKKAIRAAASQIKDNTPFCLYSDVEIPDASKKAHTLRPFLVVGSPANAITPMLKDLHGGKKLSCSGFCSMESGKISLEAKSGSVNYGLFKSQATIFKDLLGKEILIPAPGGDAADPKGAAAAVDNLKTPFGPFSYFSADKATNGTVMRSLEAAVDNIAGAQDDVKSMNAAYLEAMNLAKKLPPVNEIMKQVKKSDRITSDEARSAKMAYALFAEIKSKASDLQEDAADAAESLQTAMKDVDAHNLEEQGRKLRKQIEEEKKTIDTVVKIFTTAAKIGTDLLTIEDGLGAVDLISTLVETVGSAYSQIKTAGLEQQAEEAEEQAHKLEMDVAEGHLREAKKSVAKIIARQGDAMGRLTTARSLAKAAGRAPMKGFDKTTKGPFKFEDLQAVADRMAEARDLAKDAVDECHKAFDSAGALMGILVSGKWKVPKPDENKKIVQQMKDEAVKLGKQAGDIYKDANQRIPVWQKLYADAQETMAGANT